MLSFSIYFPLNPILLFEILLSSFKETYLSEIKNKKQKNFIIEKSNSFTSVNFYQDFSAETLAMMTIPSWHTLFLCLLKNKSKSNQQTNSILISFGQFSEIF